VITADNEALSYEAGRYRAAELDGQPLWRIHSVEERPRM